jgi:putative transposase
VILLLTEGQVSDHRSAALMLPKLPPQKVPIADRGYDSARFRAERARRGIAACIPSTRFRKHPIPHDGALYRQRHRIETMFARVKDWRSIATRDDRCTHTLLAALRRAAARDRARSSPARACSRSTSRPRASNPRSSKRSTARSQICARYGRWRPCWSSHISRSSPRWPTRGC